MILYLQGSGVGTPAQFAQLTQVPPSRWSTFGPPKAGDLWSPFGPLEWWKQIGPVDPDWESYLARKGSAATAEPNAAQANMPVQVSDTRAARPAQATPTLGRNEPESGRAQAITGDWLTDRTQALTDLAQTAYVTAQTLWDRLPDPLRWPPGAEAAPTDRQLDETADENITAGMQVPQQGLEEVPAQADGWVDLKEGEGKPSEFEGLGEAVEEMTWKEIWAETARFFAATDRIASSRPNSTAAEQQYRNETILWAIKAATGVRLNTVALGRPVAVEVEGWRGGGPGLGGGRQRDHSATLTVAEMASGELQRRYPQIYNNRAHYTFPPNFPAKVQDALKNLSEGKIPQRIEDKYEEDTRRLFAGEEFKNQYVKFSKMRLKGAMYRILSEAKDPKVRDAAAGWISGKMKESKVSFPVPDKGLKKPRAALSGVVAGIVAIRSGSHQLLVSIDSGEYYLWKESDKSPGYEKFIRQHLSQWQNKYAKPVDFYPYNLEIAIGTMGREVLAPRLSFTSSDTIHEDLMQRAMGRILSDIQGGVYTTTEFHRDSKSAIKIGIMTAIGLSLTAPAVAAATLAGGPAAAGIGAALAVGGAGLGYATAREDELRAKNTDRGDIARQAMEDAQLGYVMTVGGAGFDVSMLGVAAARQGYKAAAALVKAGQQTARRNFAKAHRPLAQLLKDPQATGIVNRGRNAWDAVYDLQALTGALTEREAAALKAAPGAKAFLGGAGREIPNLQSLASLPENSRIAFTDEAGEMIHGMLSTGKGRMAGIRNSGLDPRLSSGFDDVDMINSGVLRQTDNGFQLPDGRRVKIRTEEGIPEFRTETVHPRAGTVPNPLTDAEAAMRDTHLAQIREHPSGMVMPGAAKGLAIGEVIMEPAGKCEALMRPVGSWMKQNGYKNIRYRGMGIWDGPFADKFGNHFAVVGDLGGKSWVFDLSAGQFNRPGLNGPIVTQEDIWRNIWESSTTRKLIKTRDFNNPTSAANAFSSYGLDPLDYIPDSLLLTDPPWYRRALNAKRGLEPGHVHPRPKARKLGDAAVEGSAPKCRPSRSIGSACAALPVSEQADKKLKSAETAVKNVLESLGGKNPKAKMNAMRQMGGAGIELEDVMSDGKLLGKAAEMILRASSADDALAATARTPPQAATKAVGLLDDLVNKTYQHWNGLQGAQRAKFADDVIAGFADIPAESLDAVTTQDMDSVYRLRQLGLSVPSMFRGTASSQEKLASQAWEPVIAGREALTWRLADGTVDQDMLDELASGGVKFRRGDVVATARRPDGTIVFIEGGNANAGLQNVMKQGDEFVQAGIAESDIPVFLMKAVTMGEIVGHQSKDELSRPIYELVYHGRTQQVAVTVGVNGDIVGANMRGAKDS
ncbi:hypothetical protein [Streptomyces sp. NPDC092307]|uniref:hypothetical protein n=1 Tax=Streptomyces sp. NPDC092307 TaxID=3366013 RepID=UPI0038055678